MAPSTHVVAICGSLRDESYTQIALEHALDAAAEMGAATEMIDMRGMDIPLFDADEDEPGDVSELTRCVREADSILLGTPMYHGSYSSPLKTALDYCGFDEFENKTVGLLVVAGGGFPLSALDHLRSVCRALDAWVIPHDAAITRSHSAFDDGEFVDEDVARRVAILGERAVQYANIEPDPPHPESLENVGGGD